MTNALVQVQDGAKIMLGQMRNALVLQAQDGGRRKTVPGEVPSAIAKTMLYRVKMRNPPVLQTQDNTRSALAQERRDVVRHHDLHILQMILHQVPTLKTIVYQVRMSITPVLQVQNARSVQEHRVARVLIADIGLLKRAVDLEKIEMAPEGIGDHSCMISPR
jgi:hypothetical protein